MVELGFSRFFITMSSAAINALVHKSLCIPLIISSGKILGSELAQN